MANEQTEKQIYLSTSSAAKLLGVSVGTVQQMVETGELSAWKTAGGHRRITKESVLAMQSQRDSGATTSRDETIRTLKLYTESKINILVAEDDPVMRTIYEHTLRPLTQDAHVHYASDGIEALLHLGQKPVDLLILDLDIPSVNGFEMLQKISKNQKFSGLQVLIVTGTNISTIQEKELQDSHLTVLNKPVNRAFLQGFISGFICRSKAIKNQM